MRLYLRGGTYYCDAREEGLGRFSTGEGSLKQAKLVVANRLGQRIKEKEAAAKVVPIRPKGMALAKAFNQAMDNDWRDHAKPQSKVGNNEYAIRYFGEDKDITSFTQADVAGFKAWLREQPKVKSESTFNKKVLALSSLLKLAREEWGMEDVPVLNLKVKKPKAKRMFLYSNEELVTLKTHFLSLQDVFMADLITYLSQTGKRLSEALRLNQRDIRMDAGFIDVWVNKGNEARSVPITDAVQEVLNRRKFLANPFGELAIHQVETRFRAAREHLGLSEEATLHGLRHTYATRALENGLELQALAEILGHKDISTTLIYAKMTSKRKLDARQRIQAAFA